MQGDRERGCGEFLTHCLCCSFLLRSWTSHTLPLLQHGLPMGAQPPSGILMLWHGVSLSCGWISAPPMPSVAPSDMEGNSSTSSQEPLSYQSLVTQNQHSPTGAAKTSCSHQVMPKGSNQWKHFWHGSKTLHGLARYSHLRAGVGIYCQILP